MPRPTPDTPSSSSQPAARRLLTRAEAITLAGMVVTVSSLWLTWRVRGVTNPLLRHPEAVKLELSSNGFAANLHWPLLLCSVVCSAALLWPMTAKNRVLLISIQTACALVCFIIALWFLFLAVVPGALLGLLGSALLVWGAVDRYSTPLELEGPTRR